MILRQADTSPSPSTPSFPTADAISSPGSPLKTTVTFWLRHLRSHDTRQEALRALAEAILVLGGADEEHAGLPLPLDMDMLSTAADAVLEMIPEGADEEDEDADGDTTTLLGSIQNRLDTEYSILVGAPAVEPTESRALHRL